MTGEGSRDTDLYDVTIEPYKRPRPVKKVTPAATLSFMEGQVYGLLWDIITALEGHGTPFTVHGLAGVISVKLTEEDIRILAQHETVKLVRLNAVRYVTLD